MPTTWRTKYGLRRVRQYSPTLAEAIIAAQGLTDDREQQAEIAAELMGVSPDEAKAEIKKAAPDRRPTMTLVAPARDKGSRTVVVERKVSRRLPAGVGRGASLAARQR